ncbi:flagellin N-terminal helical domain-containing protein [Tepidibacter formicigenes]|jgi:flagellin|uniref:Flagellin n=1 Tax=Tepidibacter formicigenes DSM 15518 TaxID=1123349 RepID=A0A1M6SHP7_9FIRM|nr:flagellin [Tepidibacter formicigenes]SHK44058.1 flagellin [Tepidibacter formicigenes DSM 15518]
MRINHNISAMNAHRLLNVNNAFAQKSLEKLSSGKRINRAGDDAAGMAITEKMRAQINGLKIASRNSLDGVSLVQTAEGAMAEIHSMLQRMRELSVQAANGTAADSDRQAIQDEINQLTSEVNRIANGTEYNTRSILKGNEGPNSHALVHRMSTGKPAQYTGNVDLTSVSAGGFDLKSEQLSIWIDGEEKVVNLTQTNSSTTLDDFMELVNDALGDSAKAILDKNGSVEITTSSIGGLSKVEIDGSGAAVNLFNSVYDSTQATGKATLAGVDLTINAGADNKGKSDITIKFTEGAGAETAVWNDNVLTITLETDKADYATSDIEALIQGATTGAPAGLDMSKFTVTGAGTIDLSGIDLVATPVESKIIENPTTGTAENATNTAEGSFYFDGVPEIGSTIKIGNETIEFFDSSVAPYIGSNRPIDISGKTTAEAVVDEIVNKFATGIDGVTLSEDPKFDSGLGTSNNARLIVKFNNPGFDGNLVYLEGTPDDFTTNLQVGANTGQEFRLQIGDIRAKNLKISADNPTRNPGVKGASYVKTGATVTDGISSSMVEYAIDVSTEEKASAAIKVFDNAIVQIASERSKLGATQNRLEHTIANLDNTSENLTAAMSRIEDTDMALEMANYQKLNVLQQAGVSMLAQANQQPQAILKLLG